MKKEQKAQYDDFMPRYEAYRWCRQLRKEIRLDLSRGTADRLKGQHILTRAMKYLKDTAND